MTPTANTWLTPLNEGHVWRVAVMSCTLCGLIQKPLIPFAWDAQVFCEVLSQVAEAGGTPLLLGCTAILLRQVFAKKAQEEVGSLACGLARRRRQWTKATWVSLAGRLRALEPRDSGKRKGRMSQFSALRWVSHMLEHHSRLSKFASAAAVVGEMFNTTTNVVPPQLVRLLRPLEAQGEQVAAGWELLSPAYGPGVLHRPCGP